MHHPTNLKISAKWTFDFTNSNVLEEGNCGRYCQLLSFLNCYVDFFPRGIVVSSPMDSTSHVVFPMCSVKKSIVVCYMFKR